MSTDRPPAPASQFAAADTVLIRHDKLPFPIRMPRQIGGRYAIEDLFHVGGGMGLLFHCRDRHTGNRAILKAIKYHHSDNLRQIQGGPEETVKLVRNLRTIQRVERTVMTLVKQGGSNNIPNLNDYVLGPTPYLEGLLQYSGGRPFQFADPDLAREMLWEEPYLVIERLWGRSLDAELQVRGRFGEEEVLRIARGLLSVLIHLHQPHHFKNLERCFLFQDLKPANIMIGPCAALYLIDWGGVRVMAEGITQCHGAGTPGYAAPECPFDGLPRPSLPDGRADLYSLGVTLFELLTGIAPAQLLFNPAGDWFLPRGLNLGDHPALQAADPALRAILATATRPHREERFADAAAMRAAVCDLLARRFESKPAG